MFGHKTPRQRLKDHFIFRLNEASDSTIKADVIDRMAETLVIVSEDTMALTHQHIINEATPFEQPDIGMDNMGGKVGREFGDLMSRTFGTVDAEAITKAGQEALRGMETTAQRALKSAKAITKSAQDSFYAARVNNDDDLLQEAISILEDEGDGASIKQEMLALSEKIDLPEKWMETLYHRAKATMASRRKH